MNLARGLARPIARPIAGGLAGGEGGGSVPLPLDVFPGATAAYSLRKLRTDYSGAAIRVRESAGSTEQDIGFSGVNWDQDGLEAFVGAANGFIKTWYDQSNANNAAQATTTVQPKVATSGAAHQATFDGGDVAATASRATTGSISSLTVAGWIKTSQATAGCIASEYQTTTSNRQWFLGIDAGKLNVVISADGLFGANVKNYSSATLVNTDRWVHVAFVFDSGTLTLYVDGAVETAIKTTDGTVASIYNGIAQLAIGAINPATIGSTTNYFIGLLTDVLVYEEAKSPEDIASIYNLGVGVSPPPEAALEILSPSPYQVFQRSGGLSDIEISGTYGSYPVAIEARFNAGAWATIVSSPSAGEFYGTLPAQAEGQGTLEVRFTNNTAISDSVSNVGIGDVFIVAGQSNASSRGTSLQTYSHASLKAGLFGNDYQWKELSDPYDSSVGQVDTVSGDGGLEGGSWVVLLASLLLDELGVPVAFVPCAKGGSLIADWQPGANHLNRSTLYGSMNYRGQQVGGIKCVLWWQGESDTSLTQAQYNASLDSLADAIATDLSIPIMPCLLQNSTGLDDINEQKIRDAVTEAVADNVNVVQGPDLSGITSDDDYHLIATAKLESAALLWFNALVAEFYT